MNFAALQHNPNLPLMPAVSVFFRSMKDTGKHPTGSYLKIILFLILKPGVCLNEGEVFYLWGLNCRSPFLFNFLVSVGSVYKRWTGTHMFTLNT